MFFGSSRVWDCSDWWRTGVDFSRDHSVLIFEVSATLFGLLTVKMTPLPSFETSVNIHQSTRRDIPEDFKTRVPVHLKVQIL
jgi:hypothetical protein